MRVGQGTKKKVTVTPSMVEVQIIPKKGKTIIMLAKKMKDIVVTIRWEILTRLMEKYYPKENKKYNEVGFASWYGDDFHGNKTANGEIFDMNDMTAAHTTLPLPSIVQVTNLENGKSILVRVNDRGPFVRTRIIDLSKRAAEKLDYDYKNKGLIKVRVKFMEKETGQMLKKYGLM
jgi:rare lipoprotein A (peptidoglycan hydrolase)